MTAGKRRFIAGAVCPRCGELDRMVMYYSGAAQKRECVVCGFAETLPGQEPEKNAGEELPTRVNQPRPGQQPLAHEDEVSIVRIMDIKPEPGRD